jgi:hypothetical protein
VAFFYVLRPVSDPYTGNKVCPCDIVHDFLHNFAGFT